MIVNMKKIILSVGFLQKAPYAETEEDWKKTPAMEY